MSKRVKSWDYVAIASNYKTGYLPWPYLSCVEAQRPEILHGRRIDGPSILPNPEIADNPDTCHPVYFQLVARSPHPAHKKGWQTSQMVSGHPSKGLGTVEHSGQTYSGAWSLFPTMSWGPCSLYEAVPKWEGHFGQCRLLCLTLLATVYIKWPLMASPTAQRQPTAYRQSTAFRLSWFMSLTCPKAHFEHFK